ncbi:hypothetical protein [Providencia rettgeri]|uniref:hypothetical protein n=1 Tax=Providencia rettgeri TaxID=587 RepID=UPI0023AABF48|nr:hypothetical protein [Providencia rettgeri]
MKKIALSALALIMAAQLSQGALWAIDHSRNWYSYPISNKRITGHPKINRAAKKRKGRKG